MVLTAPSAGHHGLGPLALADILQFKLTPFLVGVGVLVVLTVVLGGLFAALVRARQRVRVLLAGLLFGLTGWALMQYFVLPVLFPLVVDKGFPPRWYAASFAVYGLALGALLAARSQPEPRPQPNAGPPLDDRPTDAPARPQSESWQEHMRRIQEGRR